MLMIWPAEKYGGAGDRDFRFEQIIIEETARQDCTEWYNTLHSRLVGPYLDRFGSEEQKMRFLPKCVSGEHILAVAMTEPGAGSDLAGMRTTLREHGAGFVLNGTKTYISNGINADLVIVAARCEPFEKQHSMALVVVERGMAGFERGRNLEKMGLKAQDTAELFFHDVHIPKENVLGEPGKGFYYLMEGLAEERLIGATGFIAAARRAFEETRSFVMTRNVFGKKLSDLQNTQFKMADLDARIELVQLYVDHCVRMHNRGALTAVMGAKAKLMASEIEWEAVDEGVQLHGGAGYMMEYPIARLFLNARVSRIYAGTSEVMRTIIGREVLSDKYRSFFE
jgi:acyl-CoA dehydrogenase